MATINKKAANRIVDGMNLGMPEWYTPLVPLYAAPPKTTMSIPGGTPQPQAMPNASTGVDLVKRYTPGNIIQARSGEYYKVVGERSAVRNTKGLTRVRGRDGKIYYMKRLTPDEVKKLGKNAPAKLPPVGQQENAPAGAEPPTPTPAPAVPTTPASSSTTAPPPWTPQSGQQEAGEWWTKEWWNEPGYYRRMY